MTRKSLFVCFVGIDGSGKTTLAKTLVEEARTQGIELKYTWCKFESALFKLLIWLKNLFVVREKDWKKNYERSLTMKTGLFQNPLARILYESFVWMAYWFQIMIKVAIPLKLGRNVVSDRYVYDTIVDLAVDLDYADRTLEHRTAQILRLVPKPDLVFYPCVSEHTAFQRKKDIPSIEFLQQKKKRYEKIIEPMDKTILDGSRPLDELKQTVVTQVLEYIGGQAL